MSGEKIRGMCSIFDICPNLASSSYQITSPPTPFYNSIAWAVGEKEQDRYWGPEPGYYWLPQVPREHSLEAYIQLFNALDFIETDHAGYEANFEKIAIYVDDDASPTHVARQLEGGCWTSKIIDLEDIEHEDLDAIAAGDLGNPACYMKRPC